MPVVVRVVLGVLAAGVILVIVFVRRARVRRDVVAAVNAKSRSLLLDKPYIQPRIQTEINDANASVDVCVFAFDNYAVAAALASAAARGVKVRVMINAGGAHLGVIQRLRRANIAHKQVSVPMGLLHAKFIVFDGGAKAIMGSANFTANGFTMNEEVMCYDEGSIAIDLQARFEMLWAKY
jgi:phosphatidylserine/phosphatidylglycerophosphate/cardiolipin synthase-like enzyme